jgi:hypothetical protein
VNPNSAQTLMCPARERSLRVRHRGPIANSNFRSAKKPLQLNALSCVRIARYGIYFVGTRPAYLIPKTASIAFMTISSWCPPQ